MMYYIKQINVL